MMQESDGEGSGDDVRELSAEINTTDCKESSGASLDQQSITNREIRSTKRPLEGGKSKPTKVSKQFKQNPEDVLLMKAIECIEKTTANDNRNQKNDPDDIFGEYIATELKSIQDMNQKRAIKFRMQSLLFFILDA